MAEDSMKNTFDLRVEFNGVRPCDLRCPKMVAIYHMHILNAPKLCIRILDSSEFYLCFAASAF